MFHKFDYYDNVNWVFARVYASLSNKHKDIDSLATLSDGLSFNINSGSFNFKWKLLEALPIKVETGRISLVVILMAVFSYGSYVFVIVF